ncbi:hypothetical protein [Bdellovibrio sp. HCB337]|uniref:hypothetical protein n=1 Tax=Bdellovibrio sp. HCB337 TaxID=3394358 RepID=UPI0039A40FA7
MRVFAQILTYVITCFVLGCVSSSVRVPASFKPKYNSKIVNSLTTAAINGVLFQINDSVFRDVPGKTVDRCKKNEAPTWSQNFMGLLEVLDKNPQYYNKFHIVDFKRGDHAAAEISKDIDGLSYLNITYAKRETREKLNSALGFPCADGVNDAIGKDLVTTYIDWPNTEAISGVLKQAPDRAKIERFQFNTEFLIFLAERQAILKINPEVAFERTFQGEYFLGSWLEKMAKETQAKDGSYDFVNYWLKEISSRSKQASPIQFFGLHSESALSYGVQVDTVGKFARKLNGFQEPTYLFMSYRQKGGEYVYGSLKDLNNCLKELTGMYRSTLTMSSSLDIDENSFLAPGYSCKIETADE